MPEHNQALVHHRYELQLQRVAEAGQLAVDEARKKSLQVIRHMAENSVTGKVAEFVGIISEKIAKLKIPQHATKIQILGFFLEAYGVMMMTEEASRGSAKSIAKLKIAEMISSYGQGLSAPIRDLLADKVVEQVFGSGE